MRCVEQIGSKAPQLVGQLDVLSDGVVARGNRIDSVIAESLDESAIPIERQQNIVVGLVDRSEVFEQVSKIGANAEIIDLSDINRDAHLPVWGRVGEHALRGRRRRTSRLVQALGALGRILVWCEDPIGCRGFGGFGGLERDNR